MSYIEYCASQRDRVCKICDDQIVRGTIALVLKGVHISPKIRDVHFHEGCLMRAIDSAKVTYSRLKDD